MIYQWRSCAWFRPVINNFCSRQQWYRYNFNVQLRMCAMRGAVDWGEWNEPTEECLYLSPRWCCKWAKPPPPNPPPPKKKEVEEEESWKLWKQKWLHTQIPESIWCKKKRQDCNLHRHYLTPSLPQPAKFPGSTMPHGCACKQYIFWSYNTSAFSAIPFQESPFTCQCEKEDRTAFKGFRFCTLTDWSSSSDVMAMKRLNQTSENWAKDVERSFYRILVSDFWTN